MLASAVALSAPASGLAATFTVTNANDSGPGSLRQAIADAKGASGADLVRFSSEVTGKITLTSGQLLLASSIQINGPGADALTISGGGKSRIFSIRSGTPVSISGLTIANGSVDGSGGGIRNDGNLTLSGDVVRDNLAQGPVDGEQEFPTLGGGIWNAGNVNLRRTTVSGNTVQGENIAGGGIGNAEAANITLDESTIAGNTAKGQGNLGGGAGGGIYNGQGGLTVRTSTISGNTSSGGSNGTGGGIETGGYGFLLQNSTVSGNVVAGGSVGAAGVNEYDIGTAKFVGSTIADNRAQGPLGPRGAVNIEIGGFDTSFIDTIVADPHGGRNCFHDGPQVTDRGYNLEDSNTCGFTKPTDKPNTNPLLGPLQDNGGPTQTQVLPQVSPAVDQGTNATGGTDQRGQLRPSIFASIPKPAGGDGSDIGAYELQAPPAQVTNTNDSGPGSLRQVLASGFSTIGFAPNVTGKIALTTGPLVLTRNVEIDGPGAGTLAVSGSNASRVFETKPGVRATISGLTITEGRYRGDDTKGGTGDLGFGGAIFNPSGATLTLDAAAVTNSSARGGDGNGTFSDFGRGGDGKGGGIQNLGTLTLKDTTVSGNTAQGGRGSDSFTKFGHGGVAFGAGIENEGTLALSNSRIAGNAAIGGDTQDGTANDGDGGGIYNVGTLTVNGGSVNGNTSRGGVPTSGERGDGFGGGIESANGKVTLDGTNVGGNTAKAGGVAGTAAGGGLVASGGTFDVSSSTLNGNTAQGGNSSGEVHGRDGRGGAVAISGGKATFANTTITGNSARGGSGGGSGIGGGIDNGGNLTLTAVTLSANQATSNGHNLFTAGGASSTLQDTIVQGGGAAGCQGAPVVSKGFNLEDANSCKLSQPTDQHDVDPKLGPLDDNGGPTKTMAIPLGSPAVDRGKSFGLDTDQRGRNRPVVFADIPKPPGGDGADVGAFEVQPSEAPKIAADPTSLDFGNQAIGTLSGTKQVKLTNTGRKDLRISDLRTAGAAREEFFLLDTDNCTEHALPTNGSCTVRLRFGPSGLGRRDAAIAIRSNAASGPDSIPLAGNGTRPAGRAATCSDHRATIVAVQGAVTRGTNHRDVIVGTPGPDRILGRGGADVICGRGGKDTLWGQKGPDKIRGGRRDDRLFGGPGNDALDGERGFNRCDGGPGRNTLTSCQVER